MKRTDDNYFEVVNNIADALSDLMNADRQATATVRRNCFRIARQAEWDKFIIHYYTAFNRALINAGKRNGT